VRQGDIVTALRRIFIRRSIRKEKDFVAGTGLPFQRLRKVSMTTLTLGLLLLGAAVGLLSAMMGIGGGIVLVPALMILFGLSQTEAQGTSLATIPFGAIIAAMIYNQSVSLRLHVIVAIAIGFVVGAYLGAKLAPQFPEASLRLAFGGLLLYLGALFVFDMQPSHPAGLVLAPLTMLVGWIMRRRGRRQAPPEPPVERHEYYI
jgi:uncharacterized membrane protein YfcA